MDVLSFRDYCLSLPLTEESTPFDETTLVYNCLLYTSDAADD